jgi:ribosome biogenesis GTPase
MNTHEYPALKEGVVRRRNLSSYLVGIEERIFSCVLSESGFGFATVTEDAYARDRRKNQSTRTRHPAPAPVVGDRVEVQPTGGATGRIVGTLPRRNWISRRAAGTSRGNPGEQILAANIDRVVAFCAVDHTPPEWHLLDRFLALAEGAELPAAVFLSKADRLPPAGHALEEIQTEAAEFRRIGYPVLECSATSGLGIEEARSILGKGTSILLGKSGAGKSSLLNALYPGWNLRVGEVNRFGEGRCTTSNAELFPLGENGAVVDTPGLRALELWGGEDRNPALGFREMRPLTARCRFGLDCRHVEEPGCALRRAVEEGRIHVRRFRSMLRLAEKRP